VTICIILDETGRKDVAPTAKKRRRGSPSASKTSSEKDHIKQRPGGDQYRGGGGEVEPPHYRVSGRGGLGEEWRVSRVGPSWKEGLRKRRTFNISSAREG